MKHKGITLISLVVTIVVLLILAGISISTVFSDNGIIKKAQEAANKTEEALTNEQEALNSLLNEMNSVIDGSGGDEGGDGGETTTGEINEQIVWSTGTATLTLTVTEPTITIQYKKNNDQSWTNYTTPITGLMHGDKVYVKGVKDGEVVIEEKQIDILDKKGPTVTIASSSSTTNSISATATATDNESGLGSRPNYTFYLKKSMEQDSAYVQVGSGTTASITKSDLEQNTAYTLKAEVSDIAGNKGQATKEISTSKIADAGDGLTSGAIVASSPTWSGGTASTTLTTNTGLTIQYQKNGISGSWSTGTNVTGLHHNDTVFARLTDGKNYGGEASITILDTVNPQISDITTGTITENSITITVNATDNESGIATYKYYIDDSLKDTLTTNSYTFSGLNAGTSYNVKVEVVDKANNTIAATKKISTISKTVENTLNIGDWVIYESNKGPLVCRVLYDGSSNVGVQLVSNNVVGSITLGSSNLSEAIDSYNNALTILNNEAKNYNNSNLSTRARCIGSSVNNENYENKQYFYNFGFSSSYSGKLLDTTMSWEKDQSALYEIESIKSDKDYWMAGRYANPTSGVTYFYIVCENTSDYNNMWNMIAIKKDYPNVATSKTAGIRPVFILYDNLKVTGGNGTEKSPYELGV